MSGLSHLKELSLADSRRRCPNLPEFARVCPKYTDRTANGLTKMIQDFLKFSGHQCERISNTGRPIDQRKQVTDVLGRVRTIGSMKWIPGTGTRGTADISATIQGRSIKIEVKCKATNDRQSEPQKRYQEEVERSGGVYIIATTFEQFYTRYKELFTPATVRVKSQNNEE